MNWKYGIGLTLVILGSVLSGLIYFIFFGVPLYLLGMVLVLISGKSPKAKALGLFIPVLVIALVWVAALWRSGR